jgi:DNA-binding MarR family transcriptional regulator
MSTRTPRIDLDALPGHLIRRLQQIAVGLFIEETAHFDLTPLQFAALATVARQPDMDQRRLARSIGFDSSTIGGVIDRLERRGLLQRNPAAEDRRVRRLTITADGHTLLAQALPAMQQAQKRILAPLPAADRATFMRLLGTLVKANNHASRAPSQPA